ncbi:MAG: DNA primase [Pirellulales bacterium]|nr:DNA primase [Pirellulales bacterium]
MLPLDAKDQIRQAIDIVDLVGSYLPLRREGRGFKALCPWHNDSRPSLQVNPTRQSFKCWVCDIGGDIFSFVMRIENLEFREALELLAERAGVKLDNRPGPANPDDSRKRWLQLMAWAEDQFHRFLQDTAEGETARHYLDERGLTEQTVEKFHLGYSPDSWDWLIKRAERSGWSAEMLEKTGLANRREGSHGHYDFFRGRVLFPIHDAQGRTIAFGGRVLPQFAEKAGGKYINTRETALFSKHKTLYGLDVAKDAITKTGTAIVMEGYTDCLMAWQFGIENCVAVLGTALGADHLRLLRRYCERVVLMLDGDAAGQKRTNEVLELFISEPIDLRVLTLPNQQDPCDFLIEHGANAFATALQSAPDAFEHALRQFTAGIDWQNDIHGATAAVEKLLSVIARAPGLNALHKDNALREAAILTQLSKTFGVHDEQLRDRLQQLRRQHASKNPTATPSATLDPQNTALLDTSPLVPLREWLSRDLEFLELLLEKPAALELAARHVGLSELGNPTSREVYGLLLQAFAAGLTPDFGQLLSSCRDERLKNLLIDLDERSQSRRATLPHEQRLYAVLSRFEQDRIDAAQRAREQQLRVDAGQEEGQLAILRDLLEQERVKRGYTQPGTS